MAEPELFQPALSPSRALTALARIGRGLHFADKDTMESHFSLSLSLSFPAGFAGLSLFSFYVKNV